MTRLREIARGLREHPPAGHTVLPELSASLVARPRVFRAPPFTEELVAAIRLISPHLPLACDENSRLAWETAQNANCWGEIDALAPILAARPRPARVLEIGPGLGRSAVFLTRQLGWHDVPFDLLEGDGKETHYTTLGPRMERSFCGSIRALEHVLAHNEIANCRVIDARAPGGRLAELPHRYDVIYSFYAIGFHWSLEHFLDDILARMHDESLAIFTVADGFEPFPALARFEHRLVEYARAYPAGATGRMLLLGKRKRQPCVTC